MKAKLQKSLLAVLLLASLPQTALAVWGFEVDNISYKVNNDSCSVTVTYQNPWAPSYDADLGDVVIPETVTHNGIIYRVTAIGNDAFSYTNSLTSITIPNSVTSIGKNAFYYCIYLTSVTLGNSITTIGDHAFADCSRLGGDLIIPNSVTTIERYAFFSCKSLSSLTLGNSVTSIGYQAFCGCNSFTGNLVIPVSVTFISEAAFEGCSSLEGISVESGNPNYDSRGNCNAIIDSESNTLIAGCNATTIPSTVTSIGQGAFRKCNGLTSITIPNSVTAIGGYTFDGCTGLISITLPNIITAIDKYTFFGCSSLASLTIPNSVKRIGDYALSRCGRLTQIYALPERPPVVGECSFKDMDYENCIVYVPVGTIQNYMAAKGWMDFKNFRELAAVQPVKGDVTGDGQVDIADVNVVINMMLGTVASDELKAACDVSGDGKVDIGDLNVIINVMLGDQ
jgi:hypothetical protein